MSTNFPQDLDQLNNPEGTQSLAGHADLHANVNDSIEAIQLKIGVDGSSDVDSIDYKINQVESQLASLGNQTTTVTELLGLDGNNDLTVYGIENKTALDSISQSSYRTIKYTLQISRGAEYCSSDYSVLNDGTNINIVESNIISNTNNNLADVTFESNAGIISLCVTPVTSSITARYIRNAIRA